MKLQIDYSIHNLRKLCEKTAIVITVAVILKGGTKMEKWTMLDYVAMLFRQDGVFGMMLLTLIMTIVFTFIYTKTFNNKGFIIFGSLLTPSAMISILSFAYTPYSWIGWLLGILMLAFISVGILRLIATASEQGTLSSVKRTQSEEVVADLKKCPNCSSANIQFMENKKKNFSVGKAAGGALLTSGIGTLAGFAGKKGNADLWHCKNCGNTFELKRK